MALACTLKFLLQLLVSLILRLASKVIWQPRFVLVVDIELQTGLSFDHILGELALDFLLELKPWIKQRCSAFDGQRLTISLDDLGLLCWLMLFVKFHSARQIRHSYFNFWLFHLDILYRFSDTLSSFNNWLFCNRGFLCLVLRWVSHHRRTSFAFCFDQILSLLLSFILRWSPWLILYLHLSRRFIFFRVFCLCTWICFFSFLGNFWWRLTFSLFFGLLFSRFLSFYSTLRFASFFTCSSSRCRLYLC